MFSGTPPGELGILALGLVLTGAVSGLVAGLFGASGSIVVVPVLYHVLATLGISESVRMQLAIGTSLATAIPASLFAMSKPGWSRAVDTRLVAHWAIPLLAGTAGGLVLLGIADGRTLSLIFAAVACAVASYIAFDGQRRRMADGQPRRAIGWLAAACLGGISAMTGISGSTVGVPLLTLLETPPPCAAAQASALGAIIAIPATLGAIMLGINAHALPPYSLGFVSLPGFVLLAPATVGGEIFGAGITGLIDERRMRLVFALFIVIASGRMLLDALG